MSAPRKKRCEGEHGSRVYASGSCVWRLARVASLVAHARMWASIRDPVHATLSLSFCHTHASLRSSTCTHTRVHARARARTGVPGWYWRAHVFAERKEKYGAGLLRGAAGKTSGFTARINSGSSGSRARQQHGNSRAGPLCLSPLEPLVLIIN